MPSCLLPLRPNLELLKNQAKDLLKAYRAGHPAAVARFRECLPGPFVSTHDRSYRPSLSLRNAQNVVALEYGFPNWSNMHAHIQEREDTAMLEMIVERVVIDRNSQQRVVVLKGREVNEYLPIWVGPAEGDSIALKLQGKEMPRPMTHDLMDSMINYLGGRVARVVIRDLEEEMFLGKVVLRRNRKTVECDSRPSDAIALAVRTGAPIYAERDVLDRAGIEFDPGTGHPISTNVRWKALSIQKIGYEFSEEVKMLLEQAGLHAHRLGHGEVTPGDILLAIIEDPGGAGARVMADLGIDLGRARQELEENDRRVDSSSTDELLAFSKASQRALSIARTEAYLLFDGQAGAEHLLLGLALAGDTPAARILKDYGVDIEAARTAVKAALRLSGVISPIDG